VTQNVIPDVSTDEQSQFKQNLAIQAALRAVRASREVLSADRTYYVRADGADTNSGLGNTAGAAFLTIQKAVNVAFTALDVSTYNVTLQIADGTYAENVTISAPCVGTGTLSIKGNSGTPANVVVSPASGAAFTVSDNAKVTIQDLKTAGATYGIFSRRGAVVTFSNVNFADVVQQIRAEDGGRIVCSGNYSISAGATSHVAAVNGNVRIQNVTVTLTGTPAFSTCYAIIWMNSLALLNGCTFSGSATGSRYDAYANGVIYTAGAGATYLPGDSGGTASAGGQYL
jgi:copper chaperone CopZ